MDPTDESPRERIRRATRAQSRLRPVTPRETQDPAHGVSGSGARPFGWLALAVAAVLVVGGWLLIRRMQADAQLQDCVMSGRKNCAPVDTTSGSPGG